MRTIGSIMAAMLLVGGAGCVQTQPRDEVIRDDSNAATAADTSPPAPAAFPPHEPRPLLNR